VHPQGDQPTRVPCAVTLGNTTWNLTGVYFDTPDITPQVQLGVYTPHQAPASPQELAYANAHPGSPLNLS
jgi:hypothetical protein